MIALAKTRPGRGMISVIDLPQPQPGPGQVLIQMEAVGLCGTDMSIHDWPENIAREYDPTFPLVLGHEMCGRVVALGPGASDELLGRRVAVNPHLYCGACRICRQGRTSICPNRKILGCHVNGGAAEWLAVRAANVVVLPHSVPPETGVLAEPAAVALHAFERLEARAWHRVAIFGAGTIGLLLGLVARALGIGRALIVGLEADRDRLELARELGLDTCMAAPEHAVREVRAWSEGDGVDLAVEATGDEQAVLAAIQVTGPGGRIGLVGFTHKPLPLLTTDLIFKERDLVAIRAYSASTWDAVVPILAQNQSALSQLVTHRLPFSSHHEAFQLLRNRLCLKTVLHP